MSWVKGVPDVTPLDFTYVTDEQMVTMNINIQLTSVEECEQFEAELKRRGLEEKRLYFQRNFTNLDRDKEAMQKFLDNL
ncbi:TPA: hypothetical protein ACGOW9_001843 [Streptococcus suis]